MWWFISVLVSVVFYYMMVIYGFRSRLILFDSSVLGSLVDFFVCLCGVMVAEVAFQAIDGDVHVIGVSSQAA